MATLAAAVAWACAAPRGADRADAEPARAPVVVLAPAVRDSMGAIFTRSTAHWNEIGEDNSLTQMLGTGRPTQREYLGCLTGRVDRDTVRVLATEPARDMRQLQFAVTGSCAHVKGLLGSWHTHPYRADPRGGGPLKERALSADDLRTFAAGSDRLVIAVWDVDSLDAAVREPAGAVRHPAAVAPR